MSHHQYNQLNESLKSKDLKGYVEETFSVDRFKSKMGEDEDVIVLGFKIKEKYPAVDLMEFFEKGYDFILDADISTGEEFDGNYHVFVEIPRTNDFPDNLNELIYGLKKLTGINEWRFKYQKSKEVHVLTNETVKTVIPLTQTDYKKYMFESKSNDIKKFFNQGAVEAILDENNNLTFKKPYFQDFTAKFLNIGNYKSLTKLLPGPVDISESGQSQSFFLTKFLGNYDINKVGNKFLIRNNNMAIILEKDRW
jgi:hypothetical protein